MNKITLLKISTPVLALLFVTQIVSGFLITIEMFFSIHKWVGRIFVLFIILHVVLNWNWIKANYFRKKPLPRSPVK